MRMRKTTLGQRYKRAIKASALGTLLAVFGMIFVGASLADEPYARSKDYDLQHSRIALRFDLDHKKVIGDVTHTVSILRDGTDKIVI